MIIAFLRQNASPFPQVHENFTGFVQPQKARATTPIWAVYTDFSKGSESRIFHFGSDGHAKKISMRNGEGSSVSKST